LDIARFLQWGIGELPGDVEVLPRRHRAIGAHAVFAAGQGVIECCHDQLAIDERMQLVAARRYGRATAPLAAPRLARKAIDLFKDVPLHAALRPLVVVSQRACKERAMIEIGQQRVAPRRPK